MILDRLAHWARVRPEAIAVVWNDAPLSYRGFHAAVLATQRHLASEGIPRSGTALVVIPDLLRAWVAVLALRSLGLDTLPVDSIEMAAELGMPDPSCLLLDEGVPASNRFRSARLLRLPKVLCAADPVDALREAPGQPGRQILLTSGTTGERKRVALDNATEDERNRSWSRAFGFDRESVFYAASFPLYTGVGYLKPSAVWHEGGRVVLEQRGQRVDSLLAQPVTSLVVTPALLRRLLSALPGPTREPQGFDLWVAGGFLPLKVAEEAVRRLATSVGVYYASTEIATITLRSRFRDVDDLVWLEPSGERELQVVDEDGRECPVGREGELRIRTTALDSACYLDNPAASTQVFRDGFFHPGDMAVRRADGRIRVLGRTADVLNLQGFKLPVAPIEQRIQEQLGVEEVCVFSGMDLRGHEELVVAIRSERSFRRDELDPVAAELPKFQSIRFVVLDEFPRQPAGLRKTDRRLLRTRLLR